jgi:very-short-patch-repair endonuclease
VGYKRQGAAHGELADLAARQQGVVSIRQLNALGYSRKVVAYAARIGRLHRIHRGVYAVGHRQLTWEGHCLAAVLAHEPAVASHTSAAWLWELLNSRPSTFHLTAPSGRRWEKGIQVHCSRLLDLDVGTRRGIQVTALPRTLLDLAGRPRQSPKTEQLLDRAAELELLDRRALEALLARTAGHPGHPRLREALRLYQPRTRVTRSELERSFLAHLEAAGLPLPATSYIVGAYEIDCYWPDERFGVELDAYATHGSPLSFERDRERVDDLLAIGVEITRVTDLRLEREPATVMARVAGHLERRRAAIRQPASDLSAVSAPSALRPAGTWDGSGTGRRRG